MQNIKYSASDTLYLKVMMIMVPHRDQSINMQYLNSNDFKQVCLLKSKFQKFCPKSMDFLSMCKIV